MLNGSEFFVVLKLCSGEQVMAVLREEDDDRILLESPMVMRTIPVLETGREHITAYPLCQFSDDRMFVILKKDVMFCKKMHHVFIPHYIRIVKEHDETSFVDKSNKAESLHWEDEETMTVDEAKKRLEMLASLLGKNTEEQEETESTLVRGNDTIH